MVKGLYTSYAGLTVQQKRLDVVSNNLANATTTGYKKEGLSTESFKDVFGIKVKDATVGYINQNVGTLNLGAKVGESYRSWRQGSIQNTGNTFDMALAGDGLFSVSFTSKSGVEQTLYTRDGSFQMNKEGYLVTKDGDYVLGEAGPIQLPTEFKEVAIEETGEIYADGQFVDRLAIANFENYDYIEAYGENFFRAVDGATQIEPTATVNQGYLETSNINVVTEMVDMISIARDFESNQKIMNTIDDMLGRMVNISEIQ